MSPLVPPIRWQYANFDDLTQRQLYQLLQLRAQVFVVEQEAIYQDLDNNDQDAIHVLALQQDELLAYCRLLPPGLKYPEQSIGRIVVKMAARKLGLGKNLLQRAIDRCIKLYPDTSIRISAQQYLEQYYHQFGFETVSTPYMEDGIPHIEMLKNIKATTILTQGGA